MRMSMGADVRELIDSAAAQPVLDGLAASTGFAFAVLDPRGGVVIAAGWRAVCNGFHRMHPETAAACDRHDRALPGLPCAPGGAVTLACPRGLVVSAAPIVFDGRDVGRTVAGQVFLRAPDLFEAAAVASRYGFDEAAYLTAIRAVPVVAPEELDAARDRLSALARGWVERGAPARGSGDDVDLVQGGVDQ
jgi:ligand-binding sensor protein